MVEVRYYTEPMVSKKEILRYAGCKGLKTQTTNVQIENLLQECLTEVLPKLSYKLCYRKLPVKIKNDLCDLGSIKVQSKDLAKNLQGCKEVILFGATIGVEIDRFITKYSHLSPAKAVMFQAIGAERIEAVCDAFCKTLEEEYQGQKMRPRFSPGYGDLALETQRTIFDVLNCSKNIGLSLNDSLLMSPSKSVTAFVGIAPKSKEGNLK